MSSPAQSDSHHCSPLLFLSWSSTSIAQCHPRIFYLLQIPFFKQSTHPHRCSLSIGTIYSHQYYLIQLHDTKKKLFIQPPNSPVSFLSSFVPHFSCIQTLHTQQRGFPSFLWCLHKLSAFKTRVSFPCNVALCTQVWCILCLTPSEKPFITRLDNSFVNSFHSIITKVIEAMGNTKRTARRFERPHLRSPPRAYCNI